MNKFARKFMLLTAMFVTVAIVAQGFSAAKAQTPVTVTWFVGLGTGTSASQLAAEHKVVDEFNKGVGAKDNITLVIQIAGNNNTATDQLTTEMAAGAAPDIVGPVGVAGSNAFVDQWMDLAPLISKNKYDLTAFDPNFVKFFQLANGGYGAIPFAAYPALLYYNQAAFDDAQLPYPPTKFGATYKLNGKELPWNYTTLAEVAKLLTVDKAGNDATSAKFDPKNIVQYGLNFQWAAMRLILTDIQPAAFYDAAKKTVTIPSAWKTATQWVWDGLWKDHYISTSSAEASSLFSPSAFASGHIAMAIVPLWYTCCLTDGTTGKALPVKWNFGVVPASLDGKPHVAEDADTFRIMKSTKNADAAFTVLSYLLNDAVPELSLAYGAYPARTSDQAGFQKSLSATYTQGLNFSVITDSFKYLNSAALHHEAYVPDFNQVQDRFASFDSLLFGDGGAKMDVNAELAKLEKDLNGMVSGQFPTETPVPTATTAAPTMAAPTMAAPTMAATMGS